VHSEVTLEVVTVPELVVTERTAAALSDFTLACLAVELASVRTKCLYVQPLPNTTQSLQNMHAIHQQAHGTT